MGGRTRLHQGRSGPCGADARGGGRVAYHLVVDRRTFLRGAAALTGAALAGGGLAGCTGGRPVAARARPRPPRTGGTGGVREVDGLPVAGWLVEENARPGTPPSQWVIPPSVGLQGYPAPIEGYADKVSYAHGDELTLYVNTVAPSFRAEVYRIGYYQGNGARLVHSTGELAGRSQPVPGPRGPVSLIECAWRPSAVLEVARDWPPGQYLVQLVGSGGQRHYVPFTLRDDASRAAIVIQSSVTTWQAYNLWGGYSLYGGAPTGALALRSRIVSFDRPYRNPDPQGSGDFIGNELPFVYLAERHGLDVTYWTDVDLHAHPELLANHRCLVSLGHDEYWSWQMRFDGATEALAKGCNLVFLGANACYRQIRLDASSSGAAHRHQICYKDYEEDPIFSTDPRLATGASWATDAPGYQYPESSLIGPMYQSYGASAPLVVADSSSWVYEGTGLRDGQALHGSPGNDVIGSEFDGFEPGLPGPRNLDVLAHSPTDSVSGQLASDMTYYAHPDGGGVFDTGTARWVQLLWDGSKSLDNALSFGISPVVEPLTQITLNVLRAFASGPASRSHPSVGNWRQFYSPSAAPVVSVDVP